MVLIVKKFVPVYSKKAKVPKKYKNLMKNKYVTTFKYPYPNIPEILVNEYGLKWDEKILVFSMKEISLPHFNRYRTRFKKVYSGSVIEFKQYIKKFMKKVG
jgi:hypothetical protein